MHKRSTMRSNNLDQAHRPGHTSAQTPSNGSDRLQEPDGACGVRVLTYERMDALFFRTTNVSPPPDSKNTKARRSATIPVPHKQPTSWLSLVQHWAAYQFQRKKSTLLAALSKQTCLFLSHLQAANPNHQTLSSIKYTTVLPRSSYCDQIVSSLRPNCCWNTNRPRKSRNSSVLSSDGRSSPRSYAQYCNVLHILGHLRASQTCYCLLSLTRSQSMHHQISTKEVVPTKAGSTLYMHHDPSKQSVNPYGVRADIYKNTQQDTSAVRIHHMLDRNLQLARRKGFCTGAHVSTRASCACLLLSLGSQFSAINHRININSPNLRYNSKADVYYFDSCQTLEKLRPPKAAPQQQPSPFNMPRVLSRERGPAFASHLHLLSPEAGTGTAGHLHL
ncbi:hypothetical protein niasHT_026656 [Heterodera trifolii]|uniref:Uncharacterized protein n=1 Tax=Heterodera trifolii TaxID=157864 RepID=A0ABD2JU78_9BILA